MNKLITTAVLTLTQGVIGLTAEQASVRASALKTITPAKPKDGDKPGTIGKFEIKAPVQFKAGETIHIEGELPKHLAVLDPAVLAQREAEQAEKDKAERERQRAALVDDILGKLTPKTADLVRDELGLDKPGKK